MRRSDLIDRPVLDMSCGRILGHVRHVLVNPAALVIAGFVLRQRGWRSPPLALEMQGVHRIGKDAVTVRDATCLEPLGERPELQEFLRAGAALENGRLITRGGTSLGHVANLDIDPDRGAIRAFIVHRTRWEEWQAPAIALPARYAVAIGPDAIVVRDEAEAVLERAAARRTDDGSDGEAVSQLRDPVRSPAPRGAFRFAEPALRWTTQAAGKLTARLRPRAPQDR